MMLQHASIHLELCGCCRQLGARHLQLHVLLLLLGRGCLYSFFMDHTRSALMTPAALNSWLFGGFLLCGLRAAERSASFLLLLLAHLDWS